MGTWAKQGILTKLWAHGLNKEFFQNYRHMA